MTQQPTWWEDFFTGLWLDVQRRANTSDRVSQEVSRILSLLPVPPGEAILDAPCGDGRIALELATRGYRMTGTDLAQPLLEEAKQQATTNGLSVTFERLDMRMLPWENAFAGAICWWGSFGYFDDEGNQEFLRTIYRALQPGGSFLFDTPIAETLLPHLPDRHWWRHDDLFSLVEWRYDAEQGRVNREFTLIRGTTIEHRYISMRLYTYRELSHLLQTVGFGQVTWRPAEGESPFKVGAQPPPIIIATK